MRPLAVVKLVVLVSAVIYGLSLLCLSYLAQDLDVSRSSHSSPWMAQTHLCHPIQANSISETRPSYPQSIWGPHEFQCLRWIETDDDGQPTGESRECWQRIRGGDAGYCKVRNVSSGDVFHTMHTTSLSLKEEARFTCGYAKQFTDFRYRAQRYVHDPPLSVSDARQDQRGIAMTVYEEVLPSAYASIRQLRDVGCKLPVELWSRHDELSADHPVIRQLVTHFGPVYLRFIHDDRARGFYIKAHAVYYSSFRQVLLMDADNFVIRDPTSLFDSRPLRRYGAVFWPDYWHPANTIFNLHGQSLVWELLDMDFVDMVEQESGQVLIDRARTYEALNRLMFFATQRPNILKKLQLVWGDKDLFRLAWLHTRKTFYFRDQRLPGTLGIVNQARQRFCGMTMVQYGAEDDEAMFIHRNTVKLKGTGADVHIWQVFQEYAAGGKFPPTIQSYSGATLFNVTSCFGVKRFLHPQHRHQVDTKNATVAIGSLFQLESKLIEYAKEAADITDIT